MRKAWLFGALSAFALASALWGKQGVVHLTDGSTVAGDVNETDPSQVVVTLHGTQASIPRDQISQIEYPGTIDDQYEAKVAKLSARDVAGRLAISQWARGVHRFDLARRITAQAIEIDPSSSAALDEMRTLTYQSALPTSGADVVVNSHSSHAAPATAPSEKRFLTADQINEIRQLELKSDDGVRVSFQNDVRRRYLATVFTNPSNFYGLSDDDQARQILSTGDPSLAKDVRILTDPASMAEYRTRIQPLLLGGCATSGCHNTNTAAGGFGLVTGDDSPRAAYTNFYMIESFSPRKSDIANALPRVMIDRTYPERSLIAQFALPQSIADAPHPGAENFRQAVTGRNDPRFQSLMYWISRALRPDIGSYADIDYRPPWTKATTRTAPTAR